jgi:hypothetical protein
MVGRYLLESTKKYALPPLLQIFVCLGFFATGTLQKLIGDSMNISECTVGRCCKSVANAILNIRKQFIEFPREEKVRKTNQDFIQIAGMLWLLLSL